MNSSDSSARRTALDPTRSFIVQAPAGSGKTELLIQRYLALLACVEAPEEVIAITFTRKAAAEMRERILSALQNARVAPAPDASHKRLTWELAAAVIARDQEKDWKLEQNPPRMRIQTIDALCSGLTRQMPLLSRFGAQPEITEQPDELYTQAARSTLDILEDKSEHSPLVEQLLTYLDNNLAKAEKLLADMLKKRGHWLRHVSGINQSTMRSTLERALENVVKEGLKALVASVPKELVAEIVALARYAAANLEKQNSESAIRACHELGALPGSAATDCDVWLGIATLLLTKDKDGAWRKKIDKDVGFPAPSTSKDPHENDKQIAWDRPP